MVGPFTLAALAASTVPALEVTGVRALGPSGEGTVHAALLRGGGGAAVVRVTAAADGAARLRSEAAALEAFRPGVRARLPFAVPAVLGRQDGARTVVVTEWVPGRPLKPSAVRPGGALASALGSGVAALHALPTGIAEGRLPVRDAASARREAADLVEQHADRLPPTVAARWREAIAFAPMWRFRPVVVHGALAPDDLLVERDALTGVLGWAGLHVGDPAADLAWALGLPVRGAADAVLSTYAEAAQPDAQVRQRATLLAELELAKWLRFALAAGDGALVADATGLLASLAARIAAPGAGSLLGEPAAVLSLHEVERLLDGHGPGLRAATAAVQRSTSSASVGNEAGAITLSAAT